MDRENHSVLDKKLLASQGSRARSNEAIKLENCPNTVLVAGMPMLGQKRENLHILFLFRVTANSEP